MCFLHIFGNNGFTSVNPDLITIIFCFLKNNWIILIQIIFLRISPCFSLFFHKAF